MAAEERNVVIVVLRECSMGTVWWLYIRVGQFNGLFGSLWQQLAPQGYAGADAHNYWMENYRLAHIQTQCTLAPPRRRSFLLYRNPNHLPTHGCMVLQ